MRDGTKAKCLEDEEEECEVRKSIKVDIAQFCSQKMKDGLTCVMIKYEMNGISVRPLREEFQPLFDKIQIITIFRSTISVNCVDWCDMHTRTS